MIELEICNCGTKPLYYMPERVPGMKVTCPNCGAEVYSCDHEDITDWDLQRDNVAKFWNVGHSQ